MITNEIDFKALIRQKFYQKHPEYNLTEKTRSLFGVFVGTNKETGKKSFYAIVTNFQTNEPGLTKEEIEELKARITGDKKPIEAFYEMFWNKNSRYLDYAGDLSINGNPNPTVDELVSYIKRRCENYDARNSGAKGSKKDDNTPKLRRSNQTLVYKVKENGELGELVFKMDFAIEDYSRPTNDVKNRRCYINIAESFDRGKGICREVITRYLPKVCSLRNVSAIVFNAVAHETNSAEKGGQEKLENFYRSCGYTKVAEDERFDFPGVMEQDFKNDDPVFYAPVQTFIESMGIY